MNKLKLIIRNQDATLSDPDINVEIANESTITRLKQEVKELIRKKKKYIKKKYIELIYKGLFLY